MGVDMADDGDDDDKRRFDVSKFNQYYLSASERLSAEFEKLSPPLSAAMKAYEASDLANLSSIIDVSGIGVAQRALESSGIGAVQRALDATVVGATARLIRDMDVAGARALVDAAGHHNMSAVDEVARLTHGVDLGGINAAIQRIIDIDVMAGGAVGRLARDLEAGVLERAMRAVGVHRVQDMMRSFVLDDIGSIFAAADLALGIGLPATFGSDFQSAVGSLSAQAQFLNNVDLQAKSSVEAFSLYDLEILLDGAVEAYDNLPDDAATVPDTQAGTWFVRRREALRDIITVLMFIIAVATYVQSFDRSGAEAIEVETAILTGIRESVDALAREMETAHRDQEAAAERQTEADAEIAEILRRISDLLREPEKDD